MKITQYAFKKSSTHWLCFNPLTNNWFVCRQKDPLIIVEFDLETQTGKIVGMGKEVGIKVENCKQYDKELKRAIEFTKSYMRKRNMVA